MSAQHATQNDPRDQLQSACDELSSRLRTGDNCSCDTIFEAYPHLAADADCAVALIAHEFLVRRELGQTVSPEDYVVRYPRFEEKLRGQLELYLTQTALFPRQDTLPATVPSPSVAAVAQRRPPLRFLGHHELFEVIGQGGMGIVCRARHTISGKEFALKMIANGVLAGDAEVQRFLREARAASELEHPNFVRIFEVGCENN
jgi:hypothetical protein